MTNPDFTKLDYTPKVEQPSYAALGFSQVEVFHCYQLDTL